MEASQKIRHLHLVAAIFDELKNQLGFGDKNLAELIINLAEKYPTLELFQAALVEQNTGFDFSALFSKSLLQLASLLKTTLARQEIEPPIPKKSTKEQAESLPISGFKEDLLKAISDNQILIVAGGTGSGKTTQIPQYLLEAGYASSGQLACSQSRSVSAITTASRVAEEYGCSLGEEVGYSIQIENCTSLQTKIKYITHNALLGEMIVDVALKQYSVIVVDDAHEQTTNTDVLLGVMKRLCLQRADLKLVVTSATMDSAEKLSKYFNSSPIFVIPGKIFPVDIFYTSAPEPNYLDAVLVTVLQLHLTEAPGDILVFLASQLDVIELHQMLSDRIKWIGSLRQSIPALTLVQIFSDLPLEIQSNVYEVAPHGSRKVLIVGGISNELISIDGVRYVVDSGFASQRVYNRTKPQCEVVITPISREIAIQRAARSGLKAPGKAFRLYTGAAYKNELPATTVPEIQRANMVRTLLTLKAIGINDWHSFDFIDAPPEVNVTAAVEHLRTLGALTQEGELTELGRKMAFEP